jgi:hypothetical protein
MKCIVYVVLRIYALKRTIVCVVLRMDLFIVVFYQRYKAINFF